MNTEKYDKRALINYLLGSSVESDTEVFDELSITDDEFADELRSAENDLIDAYLHDELGKTDSERFQAIYLTSPLRREDIEFARALQLAARRDSENTPTSKIETSAVGFGLWKAFSNLQPGLRLGIAALFLLFVSVIIWVSLDLKNRPIEEVKLEPSPSAAGSIPKIRSPHSDDVTPAPTLLPENSTLETTPQSSVSPLISPTPKPTLVPTKEKVPEISKLAAFVLLTPTRGAGNLQTISIPRGTTDVLFRLPLETDEIKTFRVSLSDQSGGILWQSGKLSARKSSLNIRIPAKLLKPQIYTLDTFSLDRVGKAEIISNYPFRAVLE